MPEHDNGRGKRDAEWCPDSTDHALSAFPEEWREHARNLIEHGQAAPGLMALIESSPDLQEALTTLFEERIGRFQAALRVLQDGPDDPRETLEGPGEEEGEDLADRAPPYTESAEYRAALESVPEEHREAMHEFVHTGQAPEELIALLQGSPEMQESLEKLFAVRVSHLQEALRALRS